MTNDIRTKEERFNSTALEYTESVYKAALYMSKNEDDARDLVQETYLRAYRFFDQFTEGTNCRAWLLRILHNVFINNCRNKMNSQRVYISDVRNMDFDMGIEHNSENTLFDVLLDDGVNSAMNSLVDKYRTVVLMADVEGLPYKEIADTIGCPIGTVMSRLHRARNILRRKLKAYAIEYGYIKPESAVEQGVF